MKQNKCLPRPGIIALVSLGLMTILLTWMSFACLGGSSYKIHFENQTKYELVVFVNNDKIGNVLPGQQVTDSGIPMNLVRLNIEAQTLQKVTIFSKTLSREDMEKISNVGYKFTIGANGDLPQN